MSRIIMCSKLSKELPAMPFKPFENELGERIFNEISMDGWRLWLEHSKMMVNEYRMDLTSQKAQEMLLKECDNFFFGEGSQLPPDFVAPPAK